MSKIPTSLTIAGTDPTGGAGIQADLKTFQELKSYGMSVITSVVAQNTLGVQDLHHLPISILEAQLNSVLSDIDVHAFKTGMLANVEMMDVIKQNITDLNAFYVLDPVMVATSGDSLINEEARDYLRNHLVPLSSLITPNIPEAEFLLNTKIKTTEDMKTAAMDIVNKLGAKAALVKGGHRTGDAIDYLYDGDDIHIFSEKRIDKKNTHGTGCTYAAAITAYLSHGLPLLDAVEKSKHFVTQAIKASFDLGKGHGPTNHWAIREDNH